MNFGFLIFPDLEELDLVGPWEIIRLLEPVCPGTGELLYDFREIRTGDLQQRDVH